MGGLQTAKRFARLIANAPAPGQRAMANRLRCADPFPARLQLHSERHLMTKGGWVKTPKRLASGPARAIRTKNLEIKYKRPRWVKMENDIPRQRISRERHALSACRGWSKPCVFVAWDRRVASQRLPRNSRIIFLQKAPFHMASRPSNGDEDAL